jgi:hypothetical protein
VSDKIRVMIRGRQEVSYSQVVEMTPEEWQEFKEVPEGEIGQRAESWIDTRDVHGAEPMEMDDAFVVDAENKPGKPRDEYRGG